MSSKVVEADAGLHSLAMAVAVRLKSEAVIILLNYFPLARDELAPVW